MSNTPSQKEQFLVITAMGPRSTSLASLLTRLCTEQRCLIVSSRMSRHGTCAALLLQIGGSWDALARLESMLPALARKEQLTISVSRSNSLEERPEALPYNVFVTAAQRPELFRSSARSSSSWKSRSRSSTASPILPSTPGP